MENKGNKAGNSASDAVYIDITLPERKYKEDEITTRERLKRYTDRARLREKVVCKLLDNPTQVSHLF